MKVNARRSDGEVYAVCLIFIRFPQHSVLDGLAISGVLYALAISATFR